jgi:hypothetical protein
MLNAKEKQRQRVYQFFKIRERHGLHTMGTLVNHSFLWNGTTINPKNKYVTN